MRRNLAALLAAVMALALVTVAPPASALPVEVCLDDECPDPPPGNPCRPHCVGVVVVGPDPPPGSPCRPHCEGAAMPPPGNPCRPTCAVVVGADAPCVAVVTALAERYACALP